MKDDMLDSSPRAGGGRGAAARGRRRQLVVAAVFVALGSAGWWVWHRPLPRRPPSPMVAAVGRLRLSLMSSLADRRPQPLGAASGASAAPVGAIAICGMPAGVRFEDSADTATAEPTAADESAAPVADAASATAAGWPQSGPAEQRILDALVRSDDAYAHAAALVIGPSGNPDDPDARLERLADMALHTTDPISTLSTAY